MPFINPDTGDDKIFELYYWDDGQWIFFETVREKEKTFLSFKDVPKGRLYIVKNLQWGQEKQVLQKEFLYVRRAKCYGINLHS